jgi:hypothetical protein
MAEQQNSGTGNTGNLGNQATGGTGSGASTQTAKDDNSLTAGASNTESAGALGNVTNKVKGLYQTAADSQVGQAAKDALGQVKDNATTAIDDKKANLAQGLTSVADTLRQVGDTLKPPAGEQPANKVAELTTQYTESLSQQVEKISGYLERQDLRGLMSDLEGFARRNPAIFLGGAFALGILAARFLKSSNPNQALVRSSDVSDFGGGVGTGGGFTSTPSSLGGASTGSSFGEKSENPYGGVTGIEDIGNKGDSFGETSGSLGSEADNVREFNTGSGAGSSTASGSGKSSTGTGSTDLKDSSSTSPKPSNKTGGDFSSSNF